MRDIQKAPTREDDDRAAEHQPAQRPAEEHGDVVVPGEQQVDEEERRQAAEHERGELALRRQRGDLAAHVLALADGGGDRLEQLGEVAADPALDVDRHHDPGEVLALEPLGHALESGLEADAQPGLDEHAAELARRSARRLRGRWCRSTGPGTGRRSASPPSAGACRAAPRLNALRRRLRLKPSHIHGSRAPNARKMMPMSSLPPPSTVPRKPATSVIPVCSSSHSEAFSWLPAPSSRALMRISRLLLRSSSWPRRRTSPWPAGPPAARRRGRPVPVRPEVYIWTASSARHLPRLRDAMVSTPEQAEARARRARPTAPSPAGR